MINEQLSDYLPLADLVNDTFVFKASDWAPGVWAGTEDQCVIDPFTGNYYKIIRVDFDHFRLIVVKLDF